MLSILFRYFSRILYDWYSMASFIDWWWLLLSVIGQQNCYMIYFLFAECGTCFVLQHCTLFASLFICFVFIYSGSFFMYLHYYDMFIDLQKDFVLILQYDLYFHVNLYLLLLLFYVYLNCSFDVVFQLNSRGLFHIVDWCCILFLYPLLASLYYCMIYISCCRMIYWTISQVSLFRLVNRFCTDRPSLVSIVRYCGILL